MKTATKSKSVPTVAFGAKLFPHLGKPTENCFFSPFSIQVALGMCTAGATGDTAKCLTELLECPSDKTEQKSFFKALNAEGKADKDQPFELCTANALWGQEGLTYKPEYAKNIKDSYGGEFNVVNYVKAKGKAVEKINGWCNEHTREKIPEIISEDFINKDTVLILTNAIYFKGKWQTEFDKKKTKPADFTNPDGTKKVPTMHLSSEFLYGETDAFQALDMPYKGNTLSMLIVLPKEQAEYSNGKGIATHSIDDNLDGVYADAVSSLRFEDKVNVSLPKFKMETKYKLGNTLKSLGAALAFSDEAKFDGITADEDLKISEVVHKAFVECDEEGTEAAAATAVGMMRCTSVRMPTPPKEFKADHPFVFYIRNHKTGNVLFSGRVYSPAK